MSYTEESDRSIICQHIYDVEKQIADTNCKIDRVIQLLTKLVESKEEVEISCLSCKHRQGENCLSEAVCFGRDEWEPVEQESKK